VLGRCCGSRETVGAMALLEVDALSKRYGRGPRRRDALRGLSFSLERDDFALLTGPSGAGKTSLIRLMLALERPSAGKIRIAGRDVHRLTRSSIPFLRRNVGVVFQDFKLLSAASAAENVGLALAVLGESPRVARRRVLAMLDRVGLLERADDAVSFLSGGEQQRVALARALVTHPPLLLADEPTGNLDPTLTIEMLRLISDFRHQGTMILLATHDPLVIESAGANRWIALEAGCLQRDDELQPRDEDDAVLLEAVA